MAQPYDPPHHNQDYSTLEVSHNYHSGLEVSPKQPAREPHVLESTIGTQPYGTSEKEHTYTPPPPPRKRICGLPVMWFWIALVAMIVIVAAAVGGGVGGSQANKNKSTDSAASESSSSSSSSPATATPTSASSSSSSTTSTSTSAYPTTTSTSWDCGTQNGTVYTSLSNSTQTDFVRYCGLNSGGNDLNGSDDLTKIPRLTFDKCMDLCVATEACIGVVHNLLDAGSVPNGCWLKSRLVKPFTVVQKDYDGPDLAIRLCDGVSCA